ncbi:MAG: response regulator [Ignavibacteriaceae bacterium]
MLDESGYDCILARDGVEALEKAEKNLPDLVISDIMMPEMYGYEFFRNFNEKYTDYRLFPN